MKKKCFICGGNLTKFAKTFGSQILRCSNCGLGETVNPKLQKGKYHRDEIYIEEENLFKNIFLKRVNIMSRFKKSGTALEIGCSTGLLLSLLKEKGWQVKGIEISKTAARDAKKRGINVITEPFENVILDKTFDLVILNHTLEHLSNPKKVVEKISGIMKKNGLIYIDLPNFNGLTSNVLKGKWPILLPNEHLWHFTLKSLNLLLTNLGFKIIYVERASGIWDYGDPAKGILLSLVNFKKRFFTEFLTAIPSFFVSKVSMGSDLMIIAKKI